MLEKFWDATYSCSMLSVQAAIYPIELSILFFNISPTGSCEEKAHSSMLFLKIILLAYIVLIATVLLVSFFCNCLSHRYLLCVQVCMLGNLASHLLDQLSNVTNSDPTLTLLNIFLDFKCPSALYMDLLHKQLMCKYLLSTKGKSGIWPSLAPIYIPLRVRSKEESSFLQPYSLILYLSFSLRGIQSSALGSMSGEALGHTCLEQPFPLLQHHYTELRGNVISN